MFFCSLLITQLVESKEYHVFISGNDANNGTAGSPFRTIQKAAAIASPGDIITVHAGTYRERIDPIRGGEADKPIVYQAAKGEKVEIKGSEVIKGWERENDKTWLVRIPNTFWGDFNPYADTIHGDWLERGQWSHSGEVYLNDKALVETPKLENVLAGKLDSAFWFCRVDADTTLIWANFNVDPNCETVEINVRQSVFYPSKPYVNYIHVRGFTMSHAATPWAPPTAEQPGLIGTHWSKGWVIENNRISHSKCVGITLGKYGDEWDNKSESVEGYINATKRALDNHWDRAYIGNHLVRNNLITDCGQAGIAGSLGAIFSRIEKNVIHDIGMQNVFWGYELAGIKLHAAVDTEICNNHIYRTEGGIWLDWMTQGTKVMGNLLHDNRLQDFSLEVNHGPILVCNNLFLSKELAQVKLSQGVAFVHNLIAWDIWPTGQADERKTPYLVPHGTAIAGFHDCPSGNVSYLNNIFTRSKQHVYDTSSLPVRMEGNVFWGEAVPSRYDKSYSTDSTFHADIKMLEKEDGWYLQITLPDTWIKEKNRPLLDTGMLGTADIPGQSFNGEGERLIVLDKDYQGKQRGKVNCPGPIGIKTNGNQLIKVFPLKHGW